MGRDPFDRDKIGCSGEALRNWVRQAEADTGARPGLTSDERARMRELEREVKELRRANEILRKASLNSTGQCNSASSLSAGVS